MTGLGRLMRLALVVVVAWLGWSFWYASRLGDRPVQPGDTVRMDEDLTVTIPDGWHGTVTRWSDSVLPPEEPITTVSMQRKSTKQGASEHLTVSAWLKPSDGYSSLRAMILCAPDAAIVYEQRSVTSYVLVLAQQTGSSPDSLLEISAFIERAKGLPVAVQFLRRGPSYVGATPVDIWEALAASMAIPPSVSLPRQMP